MKKKEKRIVIYPKDVELLTGKSYRQCVRMLARVKEAIDKSADQLITIAEFCAFYGLHPDDVYDSFNDSLKPS
jgi:hypothetical protein